MTYIVYVRCRFVYYTCLIAHLWFTTGRTIPRYILHTLNNTFCLWWVNSHFSFLIFLIFFLAKLKVTYHNPCKKDPFLWALHAYCLWHTYCIPLTTNFVYGGWTAILLPLWHLWVINFMFMTKLWHFVSPRRHICLWRIWQPFASNFECLGFFTFIKIVYEPS